MRRVDVVEVKIEKGLKRLHRNITADARKARSNAIFALVRLHEVPLGVALFDTNEDVPQKAWPRALLEQLGEEIDNHARRDGLTSWRPKDLWTGDHFVMKHLRSCKLSSPDLNVEAPKASIVIATRERPESLVRCIDSLLRLDYENFEIVIVDNDPETTNTQRCVEAHYADEPSIRYVREDIRGLSAAHNRGLAIANGDIIAFTDDDVIVDRQWLKQLVLPLTADRRICGATGLILPAELETPAQIALEMHGNFSKGFQPRLFDLTDNRPDDPLFPFRAGILGSGANMAFRTDYLREARGFDPALGAGTLAKGGDDLASLCQLVLSGKTLAYRPGALVWHHHRRESEAVSRQAFGYGVGFGAFLTSIAMKNPRVAVAGMRTAPKGVHDFLRTVFHPQNSLSKSFDKHGMSVEWPLSLSRSQLRGVLLGPIAYARSRSEIARLRRRANDCSRR